MVLTNSTMSELYEEIYQLPILRDQRHRMLELLDLMIDQEVDTPEKAIVFLDAIAPRRSLRPYIKACWGLLQSANPKLPDISLETFQYVFDLIDEWEVSSGNSYRHNARATLGQLPYVPISKSNIDLLEADYQETLRAVLDMTGMWQTDYCIPVERLAELISFGQAIPGDMPFYYLLQMPRKEMAREVEELFGLAPESLDPELLLQQLIDHGAFRV